MKAVTLLVLLAALTLPLAGQAPAPPCVPQGPNGVQFVCDQNAPEDLVAVPGGQWTHPPNSPEFGAGTVTVHLGKELWVGSYRGDRMAIFPEK